MPTRTVWDASKISMTTVTPTARQRLLTLAIVAVGLIATAGIAPFGAIQLRPMEGFIPATEAVVVICDLLIAALLASHATTIGSRRLLLLAGGFLFDALIVIPHALTFPGAFAPHGLLDAGLQTTAWLFIVWHFGLPASVIGYVFLPRKPRPLTAATVYRDAALVVGLAALLDVDCNGVWKHSACPLCGPARLHAASEHHHRIRFIGQCGCAAGAAVASAEIGLRSLADGRGGRAGGGTRCDDLCDNEPIQSRLLHKPAAFRGRIDNRIDRAARGNGPAGHPSRARQSGATARAQPQTDDARRGARRHYPRVETASQQYCPQRRGSADDSRSAGAGHRADARDHRRHHERELSCQRHHQEYSRPVPDFAREI